MSRKIVVAISSIDFAVELIQRMPSRRISDSARAALAGLFHAIDERHRHLVEFDAFELGQQAVAEHLSRDPGAVRNEVHGASMGHETPGFVLRNNR